jgi:RNA polymerase sigma-70 factor (ECF subfamily)
MWDGSMGEKSAEANGKPTSPTSVEELVLQFADRLYRIAYRLTNRADVAEDLVQEAFLDAHRNLGQLRSSESAFAWLVSILRRRRAKWLKGNARLTTIPLPASDVAADPPEPPKVIDQEELALALERLPDEFREPLVLFYFDEMKYREIAEALETPIGTVMSRIARAKAALRSILSDSGERLPTQEVRDGSL